MDKLDKDVMNYVLLPLSICQKLGEFSRTRSIALAVEICDAMNDLIYENNE